MPRDPVLGGGMDGHPHERTTTGFCTTCGAMVGEEHYRVLPDLSLATPLYYEIVAGWQSGRGGRMDE